MTPDDHDMTDLQRESVASGCGIDLGQRRSARGTFQRIDVFTDRSWTKCLRRFSLYTGIVSPFEMAEQWVCVFDGRAGARARAVFASEEQARQFAEQHAQLTATGMPHQRVTIGSP